MFLTLPGHTRLDPRRLVERPLSPPLALALGLIILLAGAAYCMGYAILSGGTNAWARAIGWSAGAVLPWLVAFVAVKRLERGRAPLDWRAVAALLALTGLASLALEAAIDRWLWGTAPAPVPLQLLRRLPAVGVLMLLLWARRAIRRQQGDLADDARPLPLGQLRYARAADNYVELYFAGRMQMERATLGGMERRLARHGFVRVHRSILVHPRHVVRLERGGRTPMLVLDDGSRLPTGERYREAIRHFVP